VWIKIKLWLSSGTSGTRVTLEKWCRRVCWSFHPYFQRTIQQLLSSSASAPSLEAVCHLTRRTKYIDNQIRPNFRAPLIPPRLANPFPRHLYPYSFQRNAVYCTPDMILASLLTVVLASFSGTTSAQEQIVYDAIHNATGIVGTWSSGAQNVLTGPVSFLFASIWFDLFYLTSCVPEFRKSCQYVVQLSINNRGLLLVVRVFAASLILSGWCLIIVLVHRMASMRFHGIGSIATVCEFSTFLHSYVLIHRQAHIQLASPAW
jgi:hypothetical protein